MTLNPEQLELLEGGTPGGFVKPSGAQTPEQPVNMAVTGFRAACQFAGYEPVPGRARFAQLASRALCFSRPRTKLNA